MLSFVVLLPMSKSQISRGWVGGGGRSGLSQMGFSTVSRRVRFDTKVIKLVILMTGRLWSPPSPPFSKPATAKMSVAIDKGAFG